MKFNYILLFLLGSALFTGNRSSAQIVGSSAFLQGHFLEVAIAPNGSWGNTNPVPAGYHSHSGAFPRPDPVTGTAPGGNGMDFSYDVGHDGWTVGSPAPASGNCCFYGAYFLPGTPFDGWSMQVNGVMSDAYYTDIPSFGTGTPYVNLPGGTLTGSVTGYQYFPGTCSQIPSHVSATWTGTAGVGNALHITQTNTVDTEADHLIVTTKFINTSGATMPGLYYFVSADPDNDVTVAGSYPTSNHIVYQGDAADRHEVCAWPPTSTGHPDAFSGLATKDCRAKAMIYQSWPPSSIAGNTLDLVWAGTATGMGTLYYTAQTTTSGMDIAYALIFKLGDLAPGDSTTLSFAWIFSDTLAIDTAFPGPKLVTLGVKHDAAATVGQCGMAGCGVAGQTFTADILNGDDRDWSQAHWTWAPSAGLSATTGTHVIVDFTALTAPTTYTITGIKDTAHGQCGTPVTFTLEVIPCFNATNNSAICEGDTLELRSHGDSLGATYQWFGPAPVPGPGIGPLIGAGQNLDIYSVPMSYNGTFRVVRTIGGVHDTTSTIVTIKPLPAVSASSNGPICSGSTLNLFSNVDLAGETWSWTGPMGFSSLASDPSRPATITGFSGIYKVVTTLNGCIDSGIVNVVIDSTPEVPTLGSNTPVCSGDTLKLTSVENTPDVTYLWNGPNGFTSTKANPNLPNVLLLAGGVYTLTVRSGMCTNVNTTNVLINPTPVPVLGSNSPVCSGNALLLTTTGAAGSTFSWVGPNSFTSTDQNPSVNPAPTAATGNYSVIVTLNNCPSAPTAIYAVVDTTPEVPTVSTNSPGGTGPAICQTDTLMLYASSATPGGSYVWGGPNSFTSSQQNPMILNATPAAIGFYTVVVSVGVCTASATLSATVTATPPLTAGSNSPICTGIPDTVFLRATSDAGAEYSWSGPYVFTSSAQNPFRTPVVGEYGGVYNVSVLLNGCTNDTSFTVIVNETPPAPWVKWLTYCQFYDAPPLQAFGSNVLWFASSAGGAGSSTPPVPPTSTTGWTFYFANQTVLNCASAIDSIKVQVNPKPNVTVKEPVATVCPRDSVVLTAISTDAIAYYHWRPYMYVADTITPVTIVHPETDMTYSVVVTNQYGCTDTAEVKVKVYPAAVITLTDSVTLFPGETHQMDPLSNCSSFHWTPSGGLSNARIAEPVASPEVSTRYFVSGVTEWGCKTKDSIDVFINTDAQLALPNAFVPGSGPNGTFKVLKRGIASLRHFRIYDRWGIVVFEAKNIDDGWDGTYKGTPQPLGVYVYEISAVSSTTGKVFNQKGNITLLR